MADCFAVFRDRDEVPAVYELVGEEVQLVGRRHVRTPIAANENAILAVLRLASEVMSVNADRLRIEAIELALACYHPSVARPIFPDVKNLTIPNSEGDLEVAKSVWREIELIGQDMEACFNVNSVSERNFESYGTHYERIIYFCCIGIESLFRKVLVENGEEKPRLTMNDFVSLRPHSRLNEFGLSLVRYPRMAEIFPFLNWSEERPSESIHWFAAYNSLKHDKKQNEVRATMRNALHSFAGYYAVAYFALGNNLFPGFLSTNYYFHFTTLPKWDLRQLYFKPDNGDWRRVPLR